MDGVPTYTNAKEMTFFRNNGFWYLGSLASWPPETHYRSTVLSFIVFLNFISSDVLRQRAVMLVKVFHRHLLKEFGKLTRHLQKSLFL